MRPSRQRSYYRVIRMLVLTLSSIVVMVLLLVLGLLVAARYDVARETTIRDEYLPQLTHNEALRTAVADQQAALRGLIITGDTRFLDAFNDGRSRYRETQQLLSELEPVSDEAGATLLRQFEVYDAWLVDIAIPEAEAALAGTLSPAQQVAILAESTNRLERFQAENEAFGDDVRAVVADTTDRLERLRQITFIAVVVASAAVIGSALFMSLRLVRAIRDPLIQLSEVVSGVDTGDTGRRAPPLSAAEFDHLGAGINRMLDTIEHQITETTAQAERFSTILESANDGIVVVDSDGIVTVLNPAASRLLAAQPEDTIGQPAHTLGVLTEREIRTQLRDAHAGGQHPIMRRIGERVISAAISALPSVDALDRRAGLVWVLRDVTELVRIDEMKSEFISIVSHELRTPLTAIKGFTDLILEGEAGEISATQREFLDIVQTNSDRLVALINDMLDISRIESGRIALQIEPIDVSEVVTRSIATLRPLVDDRQQRIQIEITGELPQVMADEARLIQILTNLISNASKYTLENGWITISAESRDTQMAIGVSDTGLGIAPEALPHVFSKFYRAESAATRDVAGTGLGLSITKSLVEMHGGRITIASRVGVGTTVRFTLPIRAESGAQSAHNHALSPATTPLVLISAGSEDEAERWTSALAGESISTARARANSVAAIAADAELRQPAAVVVRCSVDRVSGLPACDELVEEFAANESIDELVLVLVPDGHLSDGEAGTGSVLPPDVSDTDLAKRVRAVIREASSEQPRRGRVLVAEDDVDVGAWLRRVLIANGYEVVLVQDGLAAVVRAIELLPDIIILDVNMPRMGAVDVLPQLLTNPGTREIPVIVMSGTVPDAGSHFLSLGAAEFFAKPLNADLLLARLIALRERRTGGNDSRH